MHCTCDDKLSGVLCDKAIVKQIRACYSLSCTIRFSFLCIKASRDLPRCYFAATGWNLLRLLGVDFEFAHECVYMCGELYVDISVFF